MIKQAILLIALSIAIIFSMSYAQEAVQALLSAHDWVAQHLTDLFSVGNAGNIARGLIALLSIPVLIAFIPTVIYWVVRRHWFPYFMEIVWAVWLVQVGAMMVMYNAAT